MYCERQFALIHVEQLWAVNSFTAEGKILHERVDIEGHESRRLFRQEFAMAIRSLKYGLIGKSDLVELRLKPQGGVAEATPIEFKRGKDKENDCDRVQLYAQALCLEEMLGVRALRGSFYYLSSHRRTAVEFTPEIHEILSIVRISNPQRLTISQTARSNMTMRITRSRPPRRGVD